MRDLGNNLSKKLQDQKYVAIFLKLDQIARHALYSHSDDPRNFQVVVFLKPEKDETVAYQSCENDMAQSINEICNQYATIHTDQTIKFRRIPNLKQAPENQSF